jgi:L-ascorbate metabolism protein UlaG (beta-lactamase superfamily)
MWQWSRGTKFMISSGLKITYIGGPTASFEIGGMRLLTDPTFDPAGSEYKPGAYTLTKTEGPAMSPESLGDISVVLLSHDHHFDNLDHSGRDLLATVERVLTTPAGAERLGGHSIGLANWQSIDIPTPHGRVLRVTGTPARHGPAGGDRGPVTGFVLALTDTPDDGIYISGDTVWYEGIAEVSRRFDIRTAVLFMGAARVREVGPAHLTMTAEEAIQATRAFPKAAIVPLHFEGWAHFTETRSEILSAFIAAGLEDRLRWLELGSPTILDPPEA